MGAETKVYLVSCSVLRREIEQLIKQGDLNAEAVFVDKYFHVDYKLLEDNLRQVIKDTIPYAAGRMILVYGDLCLGPNGEMKSLAEEYGMVKVDALNCTDCLLGGRGKIAQVDPNHELMVLHPGMVEFFYDLENKLNQEGIDGEAFRNFFSQLRGIVLLDTLGEAEKDKAEIENLHIDLKILEVKKVGLDGVKQVLLEAIRKAQTVVKEPR